jgi:hypothetical protein
MLYKLIKKFKSNWLKNITTSLLLKRDVKTLYQLTISYFVPSTNFVVLWINQMIEFESGRVQFDLAWQVLLRSYTKLNLYLESLLVLITHVSKIPPPPKWRAAWSINTAEYTKHRHINSGFWNTTLHFPTSCGLRFSEFIVPQSVSSLLIRRQIA